MGLGKSFKKAFKKVVKVATLGAVGPGGWGSQAVGALSGGLVGDSSVYGSGGGLGGLTGNTGAADQAAKEQARLAQMQRDQEATLAANQAALQSNAQQDNIASVITGGSALGFDTSAQLKKRRTGGSLSSTLGIG
jgi:hypothetical protein